jgi:hypothetical protein
MSIDDQAGLSAENLADKFEEETIEPEVVSRGFSLPSWLYIERLDEPVEKYMSHPLNFNKSEGMSFIIRGFSALMGGILNYWWMDVIGGFLRLRKESAQKTGGEVI